MNAIWFAPAALQAVLMLVDEAYFHRRRGLPRWERWGHPVDTVFLLAALAAVGHPTLFIILAIVSMLLITKDEWVHARECQPGEQWVHAMLFIIHPLVLIAATQLHSSAIGQRFLTVQIAGILLCLFYQVFYWNLVRTK